MPYTYLGTPYTTPQGEFTVLGQGGDTSGGEYSHLRGGYINPCLGLMYDAAYAESRNKDFLTF